MKLIFVVFMLLTVAGRSQTILYSSGFGTHTNQLPAQWTFQGDNMNMSNVGSSTGYPGSGGGVYLAEGNYKGFRNTNGLYMLCSQPGVSSATLQLSSLGHSDLELILGMYKSGAGYNAVVNYQLKWSTDGINYTPVAFMHLCRR